MIRGKKILSLLLASQILFGGLAAANEAEEGINTEAGVETAAVQAEAPASLAECLTGDEILLVREIPAEPGETASAADPVQEVSIPAEEIQETEDPEEEEPEDSDPAESEAAAAEEPDKPGEPESEDVTMAGPEKPGEPESEDVTMAGPEKPSEPESADVTMADSENPGEPESEDVTMADSENPIEPESEDLTMADSENPAEPESVDTADPIPANDAEQEQAAADGLDVGAAADAAVPETADVRETVNAEVENPIDSGEETEGQPGETDFIQPADEPAVTEPVTQAGENRPAQAAAILTEGGPTLTEASAEAGLTGTGSAENETAVVSEVKVEKVETNTDYSQLSFTFTDKTTQKTYQCLITGMKPSDSNSAEGYQKLAADVAQSFLLGLPVQLSEENLKSKYGLDARLIDAEKQSIIAGSADGKQCWAASAADMIEFGGWNEFASEDEAYAAISGSFNNLGGTQQMAIQWYMNGVNPNQLVTEDGEVLYADTSTGAAQQQAPGTGGYQQDYAASSVAPDQGAYEDIEGLLDEGTEKLSDGHALGLGVYTYEGEEYIGQGHSLTVFGYVREKISEALQKLSALFVADSDNHAAGMSGEPSERANTYTLYRLGTYSNDEFDAPELEGYRSAEDTHVVIGTVTSMAPKAAAEKEQGGSKNPQTDVNLVPVKMEITDEAGTPVSDTKAGTRLTIPVEFANESYASLAENATIELTLHASVDGVKQEDRVLRISAGELRAMQSGSATMNYEAAETGEYTFQIEITGVFDGEGKKVTEAYTSDNLLGRTGTVVVEAEPAPEEEKTPEEEQIPEEEPASEERTAEDPRQQESKQPEPVTERIYRLTVEIGSEDTYSLAIERSPIKELDDTCVLRKLRTHEKISKENYRVEIREGKLVFSFEEAFLKQLRPGYTDYEYIYHGGRILIRIEIL